MMMDLDIQYQTYLVLVALVRFRTSRQVIITPIEALRGQPRDLLDKSLPLPFIFENLAWGSITEGQNIEEGGCPRAFPTPRFGSVNNSWCCLLDKVPANIRESVTEFCDIDR